MTANWVDFKKVKEGVNIEMVLDHYGVKGLRQTGDELRGRCPIHKGSGQRESKNFTVNIRKNAFKCFSQGCGAHGNVLDFVTAMERCSVRDAALKLQEWFGVGDNPTSASEDDQAGHEVIVVLRGIYSNQDGALYEVLTTATSAEDFERLVVYRELFGDYQVWIAPSENFATLESLGQPEFTLVKAL